MADRDEQAGGVEVAGLAGDGVAQRDRLEAVGAVDGVDRGVPDDVELGVGEGALLHDLGGAQLVAAHDQGDLGAEARQERRLLDRGVATTDDRDVLVAEEEAVTRGAPRDATARQGVLVGQVELAVARAGGQDHRPRGVGVGGGLDDLDLAGEVDLDHVVGDDLGAEALGLRAHLVHQGRAHDAVAEAGEVLDLGGVHQRAAGGHRTLEDQRLQAGAGGVDRGGVARGAGADDDHVAGLGHGRCTPRWGAGRRRRADAGAARPGATDPRRAGFPRPPGTGRQRSTGSTVERSTSPLPHRSRSTVWVAPVSAR